MIRADSRRIPPEDSAMPFRPCAEFSIFLEEIMAIQDRATRAMKAGARSRLDRRGGPSGGEPPFRRLSTRRP